MNSFIPKTDSYKLSHYKQYPPGTTGVFSFFESRGGRFPATTFFGLQYILLRHFCGVVVTESDIVKWRNLFALHFGDPSLFNDAGWRHILEKHGGKLPLRIKAIPEGTTVPVSNALMTIEATDPKSYWLTNYAETLLSQIWYPMTIATNSRAMRRMILQNLEKTGDPSGIDFKLHDFGYRGSTSEESAAIGGAAHLVSFMGTDNLAAIVLANDYYGAPMAGFSIPAAEHSTITSWGRENEAAAYLNMLEQYPTGLVAVVSDSYDIFEACRKIWGEDLKDKVLARDGVLVIRPDSGDPRETLPKILNILGEAFGSTLNAKGFRVLNPKVRVIQGDGIDYDMTADILNVLEACDWSGDNLAFGSGGGLLQKFDRDTQRCAIKCSAVEIDGVWHEDVCKDPVTDSGKRSKPGRLALIRDDSGFTTVKESGAGGNNLLQTVFENGELKVFQNFADIRMRALTD